MAIVPVAIVLTVLGLVKAKEANEKVEAQNKEKTWNQFTPRLDHAFDKYKAHAARNEYPQAINALKEYRDVGRQRGSFPKQDEDQINSMIKSLTFKAQDKGRELSRDFKAKEQSLKDDPLALADAHHQYIEKLKAVLPKDDTFLRKEVEHYERLNPKISLYD